MRFDKYAPIEELRSVFSHDISTGKIYWRKSGKEAGTIHSSLRSAGKRKIAYRVIGYKRFYYPAHRLMFALENGRWPAEFIDHIDGNGLNNRLDNLREATAKENARNSRLPSINTTGVKGIYWYASRNSWRAMIRVDGVLRHLGWFKEREKAVTKRRWAERHFFGEFAPNWA